MKSFATHSPGNDPSSMFRLYSHGSARFLACTGKSIPSESDRCFQQSNFRLTPIKTSKYYYDQKLTFMILRRYQTPFIVCPQSYLMNTERTINPGKSAVSRALPVDAPCLVTVRDPGIGSRSLFSAANTPATAPRAQVRRSSGDGSSGAAWIGLCFSSSRGVCQPQ